MRCLRHCSSAGWCRRCAACVHSVILQLKSYFLKTWAASQQSSWRTCWLPVQHLSSSITGSEWQRSEVRELVVCVLMGCFTRMFLSSCVCTWCFPLVLNQLFSDYTLLDKETVYIRQEMSSCVSFTCIWRNEAEKYESMCREQNKFNGPQSPLWINGGGLKFQGSNVQPSP